jgi:hypothetical protein
MEEELKSKILNLIQEEKEKENKQLSSMLS